MTTNRQIHLKEAREAAGMSQAELSTKSGISRVTISGIESGRITVTTTDTLYKLSDALGVHVAVFFEDIA